MVARLGWMIWGLVAAFAVPASAQDQPAQDPRQAAFEKLLGSIEWTAGGEGAVGKLGERGTIKVPEGFRFTAKEGTAKLMEAYGNLVSGSELGYLAPDDLSWFAVFEFDPIGYVKDDEKDSLDADAILKQLSEGQTEANKELSRRGMSTLTVDGWKVPPFYNKDTKNLEWAIRLHSSAGGQVLNYRTKILGRHGVMDVVVVCDDEQLDAVIPVYQKLLAGYQFNKEESYAAFTKGDKVAEYGLTGLIVGGGLLVAAKSGLLGKLIKPLLIGLAAVGAFLKKLFGRKSQDTAV